MGLTTESTSRQFQILVDYSFDLNSLFDNVVYAFQMELRMPNFAEFLHKVISHSFPVDFADYIQDFAWSRGIRIKRGAVPAHTEIYTSPIVALTECYNSLVRFEKMLDDAIEVCIKDGNKPCEDYLRNISASLLPNYIFQINQFVMGLEALDEDNITSLFNKEFKNFVIPYFQKG